MYCMTVYQITALLKGACAVLRHAKRKLRIKKAIGSIRLIIRVALPTWQHEQSRSSLQCSYTFLQNQKYY